MPWPVGFEPLEFKEAADWFLERVPMTREEVERLGDVAKRRAFFVSQVAELDVITQAWKAADKAIASGQTLDDFKAEIGPKLEAAWAGSVANPAARLETIFRTNVQHAYAAGRHEQMNHPAVLKRRPYREFSAVMDGRISTICKPLDGVVLPADDEFWQGRVPPLHFNCRSTVVPLTEKQAQEKGIKTAPAGAPAPLEGFGKPPGEEWKPDLTKYPEPLRELAEKKLEAAPEAPPAAPPATPPAQPPAAPPPAAPPGGNGGDGDRPPPVPPKGGPFKQAASRHVAARVNSNKPPRDENTVALPAVSLSGDAREINEGWAIEAKTRDGVRIFAVNGRVYGLEKGPTLYPMEGEGLLLLTRGAFKALRIYNDEGLSELAEWRLDQMGIGPNDREAARLVWKSSHSEAE